MVTNNAVNVKKATHHELLIEAKREMRATAEMLSDAASAAYRLAGDIWSAAYYVELASGRTKEVLDMRFEVARQYEHGDWADDECQTILWALSRPDLPDNHELIEEWVLWVANGKPKPQQPPTPPAKPLAVETEPTAAVTPQPRETIKQGAATIWQLIKQVGKAAHSIRDWRSSRRVSLPATQLSLF